MRKIIYYIIISFFQSNEFSEAVRKIQEIYIKSGLKGVIIETRNKAFKMNQISLYFLNKYIIKQININI